MPGGLGDAGFELVRPVALIEDSADFRRELGGLFHRGHKQVAQWANVLLDRLASMQEKPKRDFWPRNVRLLTDTFIASCRPASQKVERGGLDL